jgi:tRNA A-37 threonylcarbamoyl transferase component Bud32
MGAVWLVAQTRAFNRLAVVKEVIDYGDMADIQERQMAAERFEAEARTLADLKHPGIPDLYAFFSEGGHNYLVMEYIEGPDLESGLGRHEAGTGQFIEGGPLPAEQALRYTSQICEVLEYLASRQPPVVHNDIKPGNIIVDKHSGRAVLVDFGTAKTRYLRSGGEPAGNTAQGPLESQRAAVYGTVGYAAPELYRGYSEPRSDVYSLAATAYHLLTDDDPRDHPFQYPHLDALPAALADLLGAGLATEIGNRPTAAQFRQKVDGYLAGQTMTSGNAGPWPGATADASATRPDPASQPVGKLELRSTSLQLAEVGPGERVRLEIQISNRGQGRLQGEVHSSRSWLHVSQGVFACPPGAAAAVAVEVDTTGLATDQVHLAAVTLVPEGGAPEVVPVQVHVVPPAIQVTPAEVDFGTVSRRFARTPQQRITVTNVGRVAARCRVLGAAEWLQVRPEVFHLTPGARRDVELVGSLDKLPGRRQGLTLTVAPDGGQGQPVQVVLRVQAGLFD